MILGVAGKMGPTLAGLAKPPRPTAASSASPASATAGVKDWLQARGVETINCDLLDRSRDQGAAEGAEHRLHGRPQVRRRGRPVADLGDERACAGAGRAGLPALADRGVLDRLRLSLRARRRQGRDRGRGAERRPANTPVLRRPRAHVRVFLAQASARRAGCSGSTTRSTCATACCTTSRRKVRTGEPIDVSLAMSTSSGRAMPPRRRCAASAHCTAPTSPINVSGHEIIAVRDLAREIRRPLRPRAGAYRQGSSRRLADRHVEGRELFGLPVVDTEQLIAWTADWVSRAMPSLGKPTKYEVRDGRY